VEVVAVRSASRGPEKTIRCFAITQRGHQCAKASVALANGVGKYCVLHAKTRCNGEVDETVVKPVLRSEAVPRSETVKSNEEVRRQREELRRERLLITSEKSHEVLMPSESHDEIEASRPSAAVLRARDNVFRALPGEQQCNAITLRGNQCPLQTMPNSFSCRRHYITPPKQRLKPGEKLRKPPAKTDPNERTFFHNGEGTMRCSAMTAKLGLPCAYCTNNGASFCTLHSKFREENGEAGDSSDDDDLDFGASTRADRSSPAVSTEKDDSPGKESVASATSRDAPYRRKKGQERCLAATGQKQCMHASVNSTIYCYEHANFASADLPVALRASSPEEVAESSKASSDSEESSSESDSSEDDGDSVPRTYKYKEFLKMWRECEEYCGELTDDIESTRRVRGANSNMSPEDTDGQLKAQYGRLLPRAMTVGSVRF
jgi:hypothetical protein